MVAIITVSEKEIPCNISLSYNKYSNHEETISSIPTKKHTMESSTFDLTYMPRTPKSQKLTHTSTSFSIDKDEWSLYNMAPKSKKQIYYASDDRLQMAPRLPFLNDVDNEDCVRDTMNMPRDPLRTVPSLMPLSFLNNDDDIMGKAPPLPYYCDNEDDNQKENRLPTLFPRISSSSYVIHLRL